MKLVSLSIVIVANGLQQWTRRRDIIFSTVASTLIIPHDKVWAEEETNSTAKTEKLVLAGSASIDLPTVWKLDGSSLTDPVLGSVTSSFNMHTKIVNSNSIAELGGRIDTFDLNLLDLKPPRARGDIVAARKRTDQNGIIYYDWDLAVSPLECPKEQQLVVTTCLPDEVALISAAVSNGKLFVFECAVTPPQWKNFAKALRTLRNSFLLLSPSSILSQQ
mmetsp:Transcript_11981/g.15022  ORF Transcript_11981/g.15022 Transcript_11981/m.15022 type:complete len:219 (-) Transcript_11981:8-664(-)